VGALWQNIDYVAAVVLFCIGLHTVVARSNLIKKVLGLNVMETAVFAFIVTSGMIEGGSAPIVGSGTRPPFASPIPHALVLTGIVVAVSVTALALEPDRRPFTGRRARSTRTSCGSSTE
jgi:multicomponent Na+:H+ antiporter subunit C